MNIRIPEKVNEIINILRDNGFEAYAVGGCVRDMVLGREPEDWDITTSATPIEVKGLFTRTVDTGIQHGTVTVLIDKEHFEVTTYRIDGIYEDNRHPSEVLYTINLSEDLRRRDFTINAMAYNRQEGIIDLFEGMEDLNKGLIRCVGSASERFDEDALRILRAVRFSAQLGFEIEQNTLEAIKEKAPLLVNISAERIRTELTKLLISDNPDKIRILYEAGITGIILPLFDRIMETEQNNVHHIYSVGEHTIRCICNVAGKQRDNLYTPKERVILRFTMLIHDIEKPGTLSHGKDGQDHFYGHQEKGAVTARRIMRELKFDNETLEAVVHLIKWHDYRFELTPLGMRRAVSKIGKEYMNLLFEVIKADNSAKHPSIQTKEEHKLYKARSLYQDLIKADECVTLRDLKINGKDLIAEGYKSGRELGRILDDLLDAVIEDPKLNEKAKLLEIVRSTGKARNTEAARNSEQVRN